MGIFEQIAEDIRARDASIAPLGEDSRFWRQFMYAFRLTGPDGLDQLFPLVLNPTVYRKTHPFAADLSPTLEGGIYLEEQGVIISEIRVEAHTGFAPIRNPQDTGTPGATGLKLSGQAHFKRLQDRCFLEYSRLKKNLEIGPRVQLTFHNFKDKEHWIVAPKEWSLNRSASDLGRVAYPYSFTLSVLGAVEDVTDQPSEDDFVIDSISDALGALEKASASIEGGLADLVNLDLAVLVGAGGQVTLANALGGVDQILLATRGLLSGITTVVSLPYTYLGEVQADLDEAVSLVSAAANLPADVVQIIRDTIDAIDTIAAYPEKFVDPFPQAAQRFLDLTRGPGNASTAELQAASTTTITQAQSLRSSALRPGDQARVAGRVYSGARDFPRYEGFREVTTNYNDTLAGLAAAYLGDARRWVDIAIANQLSFPYISEEGLPGTVRPGNPILVPTLARGGDSGQIRSRGERTNPSKLEAILGRDLLLAFDDRGRADLVVDAALGSVDMKTVAGTPNMQQAIRFILTVEQGEDVLYTNNGVRRIVGRRGTFDRLIDAELRVAEAISADPRVSRVANVDFNFDENGALNVELDVVLVDNTQSRVIGQVIS